MSQIDEISFRQLKSSLEMQTHLREHYERIGNDAREQLIELAVVFCPQEVDQLWKEGEDLNRWEPKRLGSLLTRHLRNRLEMAALTGHTDLVDRLREAEALNGELERKEADARAGMSRLQSELLDCRHQLALAQEGIDSLRQRQPSAPASEAKVIRDVDGGVSQVRAMKREDWPEWMTKWAAAKGFDRQRCTLICIGRTGYCRQSVIASELRKQPGMEPKDAVFRAMQRLSTLGLLTIDQPWSATVGAGRPPNRAMLTGQGKEAYQLLTGGEAVASEYDALLIEHKSANQVLTVLIVADELAKDGYEVDIRRRAPIMLPGGRQLKPDLRLRRDGKTIYVEVELDTRKDRAQRRAKWRNACEAGGGNIYVITDKARTMKNIVGEIVHVPDMPPFTLYLSNATDLIAGKRHPDNGIWLRIDRRHARESSLEVRQNK